MSSFGDSRLDGGDTPEPGKQELVCALMPMEGDLSQIRKRFTKCVHLSNVHIIFVIIHPQCIFAFIERPCAVSHE